MTRATRRAASVAAAVAVALLATACGGDDKTRTVTAEDYRFENLPKSVSVGTTLTLKNASTKEVHEMVLIRIPEAERRPVSELIKLPEAELDRLFSDDPAMVLIRPPGNGQLIKAVGDGKLTQSGRFAVICAIPTGADPQAYLAAAQNAQGGPPEVAGGPPHFIQGMYSEISVK